jgi:hypothetical protein
MTKIERKKDHRHTTVLQPGSRRLRFSLMSAEADDVEVQDFTLRFTESDEEYVQRQLTDHHKDVSVESSQ